MYYEFFFRAEDGTRKSFMELVGSLTGRERKGFGRESQISCIFIIIGM
jgi:hypothetical protein